MFASVFVLCMCVGEAECHPPLTVICVFRLPTVGRPEIRSLAGEQSGKGDMRYQSTSKFHYEGHNLKGKKAVS